MSILEQSTEEWKTSSGFTKQVSGNEGPQLKAQSTWNQNQKKKEKGLLRQEVRVWMTRGQRTEDCTSVLKLVTLLLMTNYLCDSSYRPKKNECADDPQAVA